MAMPALIATSAILLLAIGLIILQPRDLNEAWAAIGGAAAMLLFGFATPLDLWHVTREVTDVLLFLIGMMALTAAVERSGLFDLLAIRTARAARGSGTALFVGVFLLGFVITALLSLDVTVIVLTPIVYALVYRLGIKPLPFLFVCTFIANNGSLLFPISNLTNLLAYGLLGLSFTGFAARMLLPQLVALAVNIGLFFVIFRRDLPQHFDPADLPRRPVGLDLDYLRAATVGLGLVLAALFACGLLGWPIALPALLGGATLAAIAVTRHKATARELAREVSWSLVPFVIGMFLIIRSAQHVWLAEFGDRLTLARFDLPALLLMAFGTGVGANLINNIPMIGAAIGLLARATPAAREPLALAAVLGTNLGPTVTPFGSLATMLWLTIVRRRGETLTTLTYMKVGAITAPTTLLAATLALWLVLR
jgi:arsenical pump membrane protein